MLLGCWLGIIGLELELGSGEEPLLEGAVEIGPMREEGTCVLSE